VTERAKNSISVIVWTGGRVVEGTGLEIRPWPCARVAQRIKWSGFVGKLAAPVASDIALYRAMRRHPFAKCLQKAERRSHHRRPHLGPSHEAVGVFPITRQIEPEALGCLTLPAARWPAAPLAQQELSIAPPRCRAGDGRARVGCLQGAPGWRCQCAAGRPPGSARWKTTPSPCSCRRASPRCRPCR
jgi:hypothetical protein